MFSRSASIPFFVVFTTRPRSPLLAREIAADAMPLCGAPSAVIQGEHGLVRSVVLNDRIHALTVDTAGEVAVWDIVRCVCKGRYVPEDVAAADAVVAVAYEAPALVVPAEAPARDAHLRISHRVLASYDRRSRHEGTLECISSRSVHRSDMRCGCSLPSFLRALGKLGNA